MAKITKATIKSFIKKNKGNLLIKFDNKFIPAIHCETCEDPNLGIAGIWFGKRNFYKGFRNDDYNGFAINNSNYNSIICIKN